MTDFNYNLGVPNPPNRPSADVPLMQTNTNSIAGWAAIDHVGYATSNNLGGTHLQTAFGGFSSGPLPSGTPASVMYPAAGTASNTTAQLYFDNSLASVVLSSVRAFASIPGQTLPANTDVEMTVTNSYNVILGSGQSTLFRNTTGPTLGISYTIILEPDCVIGSNAAVFITGSSSSITFSYSFPSSNTLEIFIPGFSAVMPSFTNFVILQV